MTFSPGPIGGTVVHVVRNCLSSLFMAVLVKLADHRPAARLAHNTSVSLFLNHNFKSDFHLNIFSLRLSGCVAKKGNVN